MRRYFSRGRRRSPVPYGMWDNITCVPREISAVELAARLQVSHGRAAELMRSGVIGARQLPSNEWLTSERVLEVYLATARRGGGRALSAATAWGVLWELSGLKPTWLSSSTLSRLRAQIATWSAEEIVRATTGRTRVTRFMSAENRAHDGVIESGAPASRGLQVRLWRDEKILCGYVREGTVLQHARMYGLRPDYEGQHTLLENTLPIPWRGKRMPAAVVACDLTRSLRPKERSAGVAALTRIKAQWLESR